MPIVCQDNTISHYHGGAANQECLGGKGGKDGDGEGEKKLFKVQTDF